MTYSENKFREYLKKIFPGAYIKKVPDKKNMASGQLIGLPDYMIITNGCTYWFEVKEIKSKKYAPHTFNLNEISDTQYTEFNAMHKAGAKIFIAIYLNKELYVVSYDYIQFSKWISGEKSIHKDTLNKWGVKW